MPGSPRSRSRIAIMAGMHRRSRLIMISAVGVISCNPPPPTVESPLPIDGPPGRTVVEETPGPEPVPSGLPPLADREAAMSTAPLPETLARDAVMGSALNPADDQGRPLYLSHSGEGCYVELPFPPGAMVPPGSAPPMKAVTCPEILADSAWLACRTGSIHTAGPDADACICSIMGNPPPAPRWVHCPGTD